MQSVSYCVLILLGLFVLVSSRDKELRISPPYNLIKLANVDFYILPVLLYDNDMLEPYIGEATVEVHLEGHHDAYKRKMNAALKEWRTEEPDNKFATAAIVNILRNLEKVPEKYRKTLTNNGGGFVNHAIYWGCMSPYDKITQREPTEGLRAEIEKTFGSYEQFKELFTQEAKTLFGSGYVWLSRQPKAQGSGLVLSATSNQDTPISQGLYPILVLDVWEHAYYLKYQHRRVDYIDAWWNVVDWENVDDLDKWWQDLYEMKKDEL